MTSEQKALEIERFERRSIRNVLEENHRVVAALSSFHQLTKNMVDAANTRVQHDSSLNLTSLVSNMRFDSGENLKRTFEAFDLEEKIATMRTEALKERMEFQSNYASWSKVDGSINQILQQSIELVQELSRIYWLEMIDAEFFKGESVDTGNNLATRNAMKLLLRCNYLVRLATIQMMKSAKATTIFRWKKQVEKTEVVLNEIKKRLEIEKSNFEPIQLSTIHFTEQDKLEYLIEEWDSSKVNITEYPVSDLMFNRRKFGVRTRFIFQKMRNSKITPIPGDGNCLYTAISAGLGLDTSKNSEIRRLAVNSLFSMDESDQFDQESKDEYILDQFQQGQYGEIHSLYALAFSMEIDFAIYVTGMGPDKIMLISKEGDRKLSEYKLVYLKMDVESKHFDLILPPSDN